MCANDVMKEEFQTLRAEIMATKARLFWIVGMGLLGVPLLAYLAAQEGHFFVSLLLPYSVLVAIELFLAEQHTMMRAGRYIRERIEAGAGSPGWETWVESRPQFRLVDRHFVACFIIAFFLFYFLTIGQAVDQILGREAKDLSGTGVYWYWLFGALLTYAIGGIWVASSLMQHWRSTISTSTNAE
jgi:hypothetical protein